MKSAFLFILFLGIALRILLIGNTGFLADIAFWKSWSLAAADHGIVWTAFNTNINYPPGFIYVLWGMGKVYTLFGDPHNFNDFWRDNNFGFLLAAKSIAIISDVAIAILIYWFFSQKEKLKQLGADIGNWKLEIGNWKFSSLPLLLSCVFFLNPVVILDSALWGQVESFGILFTLLSIILIFYKKPHLASFIFTIGTLMKLQNIIYIPIFFLFIARYFDLKTMIRSLGSAALAFFLICLPFIWQGKMNQVLYLLTVNSDYFPWLSLNAHNLWWIAAGGHGMAVIDKITIWGVTNAKTFGLFLFGSIYLLSCLLVLIKPKPKNLFLSLSIGIFAFFLFTTESHERYSYPVLIFLLFFYPFIQDKIRDAKFEIRKIFPISQFPNFQLYFWLIFFLLTLTIFFNIHMGLVINYPANGFLWLTRLTTTPMTIINSYVLLFLFFLLLPFIFMEISSYYIGLSGLVFALLLLTVNISFIFKKPVSLTAYKPVSIKQDYAYPQINMSINSEKNNWKSWNRLSNNYFFYRKGIGSHANSNLVFDINKGYKTFATDIGIDTEAPTYATVVFQIFGDGKKIYESKKMGRFDYPAHVEVNIAEVKNLGLVITDAGDGINSDHADWLNPTLYR